jgi:putative PIN family toxin of toxin-antitoxin system
MTVAVFDTNVVVSGILSPTGAPARILDAILDGFCQPVVTDAILAEYEEVLSRPKFRFPPTKIRLLLAAIRSRAVFAPFAPEAIRQALPDPDDAIFVEAALGLHVPIVTGNPKHFPARAIGDISVLFPAAFLSQLVDHE